MAARQDCAGHADSQPVTIGNGSACSNSIIVANPERALTLCGKNVLCGLRLCG